MNGKSALIVSAFWAASLYAADAHVHGAAKMNLSVDNQEVTIELETPLANTLSYEHKPQNAEQEKEARQMAATLRKADKLFIFPPKAECKLVSVELDSDALDDDILGNATRHDHDDHDEHDHDDHEHGEHADLDAEFSFVCHNPKALNKIEVNLFKFFPNLNEIEAQIVTANAQSASELTAKSRVITIAK
ncbi:MAG: DUF2796 domain-containing protein [Helicobacteraceae bacterium]|jgi:hypothetical protein|nr:DUF2796 domain-containing protein [Helicobacteraceae bacterium]